MEGIEKRGVKEALIEVSKCIQKDNNYYITSDISDFFQNINRQETNRVIFSLLHDETINNLIEDSLRCEIINSTHKIIQSHINLFPKDQDRCSTRMLFVSFVRKYISVRIR